MGLLITFEGTEGSGKTTQAKLAADYLTQDGYPVVFTAEPGGTSSGEKIRAMLLDRAQVQLCAEAELLLFCADRAQHVRELIAPALKKRYIVICDRYTDATIAYQGFGRGLDIGTIRQIEAICTGDIRPHLTLLFDVDVDTGLRRVTARSPMRDRLEEEEHAFHERVRHGYLTLAAEEPHRIHVIDASGDILSIHTQVRSILDRFINEVYTGDL